MIVRDPVLVNDELEGDLAEIGAFRAELTVELLRAKTSAALFKKTVELPRLGRFEIRHTLGRGAMATVYEAWDLRLLRSVALKVVPLADLAGDAQAEHWLREARAMAALRHPNILTVHEAEMVGDNVVIVLEKMAGGNLRNFLQAQTSWQNVVKVFVQVGRGLAAAHEAGLVHRDIKPENILLDGERAVLGDFGLARAPLHSVHAGSILAHHSGLAGTPHYMAPELFDGQPPDAVTDQYSYFASLAESLKACPGKNRRLQNLVARGMSERASRFANMDEACTHLEKLVRPKRWGVLALLAGFAAVVSLALFWPNSSQVPNHAAMCQAEFQFSEWDDAARQNLRQAFTNSHSPIAADMANRVIATVDQFAGKLSAQLQSACSEVSPSGNNPRVKCLEKAAYRVSSALALMSHPSAKDVANSPEMVSKISNLQECEQSLQRAGKEPAGVLLSAQVSAYEKKFEAWKAVSELGQYREVVAGMRRDLPTIERLAHDPLTALAYAELGGAYRSLSQWKEAEEFLGKALLLAERTSNDFLSARIWTNLSAAARAQDRLDEAKHSWQQAEAKWQRLGRPEILSGGLEQSAGSLAQKQNDLVAAKEHFEKALAINQRLGRNDIARSLMATLARTYDALGERKAAHEIAADLRDQAARAVGTQHPVYAQSLVELATAEGRLGRNSQAIAYDLEAAAIFANVYGEDSQEYSSVLNELSTFYALTGQNDLAEQTLRKVLQLREKKYGPQHSSLTVPLLNLANAIMQKRPEEARAYLERSIAIQKALAAKTELAKKDLAKPYHALALTYHAQAEREKSPRKQRGFVALATKYFRDALQIAETEGGLDGPVTVMVCASYGRFLASFDPKQALPLLLRVVATKQRRPPADTAESEFMLAKVYWRLAKKDLADQAVQNALARVENIADKSVEDFRAKVKAWHNAPR